MKNALKLFVCSFLLISVFGCSISNKKDDSNSKKEDKVVKEDKKVENDNTADDQKKDIKERTSLEQKYDQLQKDLEKEEGFFLNGELNYKEDEANGLKYTQNIEKQTNSSDESYGIATYYTEDSAKSAESQWNEMKTTTDGKTLGITYNEEKEATYYHYREGSVIVSAGGYGANDQVLNNLKKYYSLEIK